MDYFKSPLPYHQTGQGLQGSQAANERASEPRGVFETVSALSVRAAAEELTRRAGAERWAVAPNAGGAGPAEVGMLEHLRICSPACQLLEPGDRRQRMSRSTGSVRPRRQGHPSSPFSEVGPRRTPI